MKSIYQLDPLEFAGLKTEPLSKRPSKVTPRDFARPFKRGGKFKDFLKTLPAMRYYTRKGLLSHNRNEPPAP